MIYTECHFICSMHFMCHFCVICAYRRVQYISAVSEVRSSFFTTATDIADT